MKRRRVVKEYANLFDRVGLDVVHFAVTQNLNPVENGESDTATVIALLRSSKQWTSLLVPWILSEVLRKALVSPAVVTNASYRMSNFIECCLEQADMRETRHLVLALTMLQLAQREYRSAMMVAIGRITNMTLPFYCRPRFHGDDDIKNIYYYCEKTGVVSAIANHMGLKCVDMPHNLFDMVYQYCSYCLENRIEDKVWHSPHNTTWERTRSLIYDKMRQVLPAVRVDGATTTTTTRWDNVIIDGHHIFSDQMESFRAQCYRCISSVMHDVAIKETIKTLATSKLNHTSMAERVNEYNLAQL